MGTGRSERIAADVDSATDRTEGMDLADVLAELDGQMRFSRRRMIGYLLAGSTLIAGASWKPVRAAAANGAVPTVQPIDLLDLSDLLNAAGALTAGGIHVAVNEDGTVAFALPRAEVGQGITTATAMIIADEMDVPLERVNITLADANPRLAFSQFTGGSNSIHSIYVPLRTAAAAARARLVEAAASKLGEPAATLTVSEGVISSPSGRTADFGSLAREAAVRESKAVEVTLKPTSKRRVVGTPQRRIDARDAVTGRKVFALDTEVPGALPTMVCRPPTINGTALEVRNRTEVENMPGITDVALIPHDRFVPGGVAVRGKTFGQCIDAIRALDVSWGPGSVEGYSTESVQADLNHAELPMAPPLTLGGKVLDQKFTFHFRPGDPLEPNTAVADVREDSAEIWSCLKSPVWAKQEIAADLGLPDGAVTVHVSEGGGSFGRHLFSDAAFEAAKISRAIGNKPVKLMWSRTDNFRQGRVHPMCTSRVRIVHNDNSVLALDQRHTSVATDYTHGLAEILTAGAAALPLQNFLEYSVTIFELTANVPYNFGAVDQVINEIYEYNRFNTSSVRNIYSPDVRTAVELMVDQTAAAMGKDPYEFRQEFCRHERGRAVLAKVAEVGKWGRKLPRGVAQGIALHNEYKGFVATLVEIDTRRRTVKRKVQHGYTGPRVTKVVCAVDVGLPINPMGLEAQMMGGIMDGIGQALTYGLHLEDGVFLEGSWDDAYYTRQWNVPKSLKVIVMPQTTDTAGGAGELGVPAAMAATACAYARATGEMPTSFPINHDEPIKFHVFPTIPPTPPAPTDGLKGVR